MAAPQLQSSTPSQRETNVPVNRVVSFTFDSLDASSVTNNSVSIAPVGSPADTLGDTVSVTGNTIYVVPATSLARNTAYQVTVSKSVRSSDGTELGIPLTLVFQTGSYVEDDGTTFPDPWNITGSPYEELPTSESSSGPTLFSSTPAQNAFNVKVRPDMDGSLASITLKLSEALGGSLTATTVVEPVDGDPRRKTPAPMLNTISESDEGKTITLSYLQQELCYHVHDWDPDKETLKALSIWPENAKVTITVTGDGGSITLNFTTAYFPFYTIPGRVLHGLSIFWNRSKMSLGDLNYVIFMESDYLLQTLQSIQKDIDFEHPSLTMIRWTECAVKMRVIEASLLEDGILGDVQSKQLGDFSIRYSGNGGSSAGRQMIDRLLADINDCLSGAWMSLIPTNSVLYSMPGHLVHVPRRVYLYNGWTDEDPPIRDPHIIYQR